MARVEGFFNRDVSNLYDLAYSTLNAWMLSDPLVTCLFNLTVHSNQLATFGKNNYFKLIKEASSHVALGSGLSFLMRKAWQKPIFFGYLGFVCIYKLAEKNENSIPPQAKKIFLNYIKPAGQKISQFAEGKCGKVTSIFIAALRIVAPIATFLETRRRY